jgi:RimJ/RimL family protein N-acetyltransferase
VSRQRLPTARLPAMTDPIPTARASFPPDGRVPLLRGDLVYLRPGERSDIPLFVRWFTDARTTRTLMFVAPVGTAGEEAWFTQMSEHHGSDRWFFVICRLADDRPVGSIDLHEIDLRNGSASLGIAIGDPADTGQGYGSDALRTLVAFGFDELRLERIALDVYDFNEGARRMYERVGFRHEGTLRRALFSHGAHHDVHRMSILRDEWAAIGWRPGSAAG